MLFQMSDSLQNGQQGARAQLGAQEGAHQCTRQGVQQGANQGEQQGAHQGEQLDAQQADQGDVPFAT